MRNYRIVLALVFTLVGCYDYRKTEHFTIVFSNESLVNVQFKINGVVVTPVVPATKSTKQRIPIEVPNTGISTAPTNDWYGAVAGADVVGAVVLVREQSCQLSRRATNSVRFMYYKGDLYGYVYCSVID